MVAVSLIAALGRVKQEAQKFKVLLPYELLWDNLLVHYEDVSLP